MEEKKIDVQDPVIPAPPKIPEELVEKAHMAAAQVLIEQSDPVKEEILKGAEHVVHNKTQAIRNRAEQEAKKALFDNNKSACGCFGFEEETTEGWAVRMMRVWHNFATAIWILIGMVTFAPVVFLASKIKVIVKKSWVAVLLAIVLYLAWVLSPLWLHFLGTLEGLV